MSLDPYGAIEPTPFTYSMPLPLPTIERKKEKKSIDWKNTKSPLKHACEKRMRVG